MKSKSPLSTINWYVTTLILLLSFGCAKDRPEVFEQGADYGLMQISEFQGKSFEVETGDSLSSNKLSNASVSSFSVELEEFRDLDFVSLVNPHELIRDVPFRGRPHHKYLMEVELYDDYLIVYKTATKADLPSVELTYAEPHPTKENFFRVTMVGYPVSLVGVENQKNDNGEQTHKLSTFERSKVSQASHFKYNLSSRILFEAAEKFNTFPKNMFDGEWFFANTVVETAINSDSRSGHKLSQLSRIKFIPEQNGIRAVNVSIDKEIEDDDYLNNETAFFIPGEWVDFKRGNTGSGKFTEEKLGDWNPKSRPWKERGHIQLKFEQIEGITESSSETPKFDNLQLSKGHIGLVYTYKGSGLKIHLSLKSAHAPKLESARVYPEKDWERFGFFQTQRNVLQNYTFERESDFQKNLLISKFMPDSSNKIVYHFSTISSKNPMMREVGRTAIKSWSETFKKAGTNIQIELDESFDVDLGDIRYNIINLVDTKSGTSLLGYGPSVADSESGEIISATANIYTYPLRSSIYRTIRNYIRYKLGMIKEDASPFIEEYGSAGPSSMGTTSGANMSLFLQPSMTAKDYFTHRDLNTGTNKSHISNEIYGIPPITNNSEIELSENEKKNYQQLKNDYTGNTKTTSLKREWVSKHSLYGGQCSFAVEVKDRIKQIEESCPQVLEFIEKLKQKNNGVAPSNIAINTNEELPVLDVCVEKLLYADTLGTLVHELGHNFGLAHNFAASADEINFLKDQNGKLLAQTSSVMDYIPGNHDLSLIPGLYDTAAIKFGYAQKVDLTNGRELDLTPYVKFGNPNPYSLDQILKENNVEMKPYKYCADWRAEDAPTILRIDPLCRRHDFGANPFEIVKRLESHFWASYYVGYHRFDRYQEPNQDNFAEMFKETVFFPIKEIYDQWRYYLKEITPIENDGKYLTDFDEEKMQAMADKMKDEEFLLEFYRGNHVKAKLVKSYTLAAEYIGDFLTRLIKTPAKTCRAVALDNSVAAPRLFDFERIRSDIFEKTGSEVKNCLDLEAVQYFASIGYKPTADFGENIDAIIRSREIEENAEIDAVGLGSARAFAMATLGARTPFLKQNLIENFVPAILDDPRIRNSIEKFLINRVMNGLNDQTMSLGQKDTSELKNDGNYMLFKTESRLIENLFNNFLVGLNIPDDASTTEMRKLKYRVLLGPNPRLLPGAVRSFRGGVYVGIPQEAENAEAIMQAYEFTTVNLNSQLPDAPTLQTLDETASMIEKIGFYKYQDLIIDEQPIKMSQLYSQAQKIKATIQSMKNPVIEKILINTYASSYFKLLEIFEREMTEDNMKQILEIDAEQFVRSVTDGQVGIEIFELDSLIQQVSIKDLNQEINAQLVSDYNRILKLHEDVEETKAQLDLLNNIILMFNRELN